MNSVDETIYGPVRRLERGELLLELLSEEIPARMQRRAIEDLTALLLDKLAVAQIPAQRLDHYVTPRRLTVIGRGIPERQPERSEERRGPRVGAPQVALDGFLRAAGLDSIEQCEIRDTSRGEFYFAVLHRPGRAAAEVLPELLRAAIDELPWPKSMRYPAASLRWVRPLISVVCLFDGAALPLSLDRIPVGRTTRGHRFLSEGEIAVDNADDYRERLKAAYVILGQDDRRNMIGTDLDRLAAAEGLAVTPDPALLDEVTGLVEFPVVLAGSIDVDFMALPPELLATVMRTHQKYFSCLQSDATPAPRFLFVADNLAADGGKTIVAGNQRVLRARLADARFFWEQDRKVPLEARIKELKDRVFHAKLGNMRDRVDRIEQLAIFLKSYLPGDWGVGLARRAALLAKADLSSGMVGEFPELQGIMGRYYALNDGEDPRVADAIAEHYKPVGPDDTCPHAPVSVVIALADKIISLVGFFSVGERPTGSRDPFALRRAALGIIRLIVENELRLPLSSAFVEALKIWDLMLPDIAGELLAFIAERLKVHLREQGVRHDLIAAAFTQTDGRGAEDDLIRLLERVKALQALLSTEYGADLLVAYRRASSIVGIEERRDGRRYDGEIDRSLLREPAETPLFMILDHVDRRIGPLLATQSFMEAMSELATLRQPVDDFFDKVTVNCDDAELRANRLRLLSRIRTTLNRVADFSQIEG